MWMLVAILVLLVLAAAIFIATRPEKLLVERSGQIGAPPQAVFAAIQDFHEWSKWSPWEKLDPAMKKTFEGAQAGAGAIYTWNGNSKAGEGRMTIVEATPGKRVLLKLEFSRPYKSENTSSFELTPNAEGTMVRWSMESKHNLMTKLMSPLLDGMLGKDFEQGLSNLNSVVR